jgi:hypothetical protein
MNQSFPCRIQIRSQSNSHFLRCEKYIKRNEELRNRLWRFNSAYIFIPSNRYLTHARPQTDGCVWFLCCLSEVSFRYLNFRTHTHRKEADRNRHGARRDKRHASETEQRNKQTGRT